VEKIHKQLDNNKRYTNKSMDVGVDNWNVGGTLFCQLNTFSCASFTSISPGGPSPLRNPSPEIQQEATRSSVQVNAPTHLFLLRGETTRSNTVPAVTIATAYVSKQGIHVVAIFIILKSRKDMRQEYM
jgi:hypothetical protein